jgi:fimbrial chaperone protein
MAGPRSTTIATILFGLYVAAAAPYGAPRSTLVIWPIDPVLEQGQTAAPLWLENRGVEPLTLQIRVVGWRTADFDDVFMDEQEDIVASPPVARVAPGTRQFVRLVRTSRTPLEGEQAYRVIIDELPAQRDEPAAVSELALGVALRLRYSLPLFVYGGGLVADRRSQTTTLARSAEAAVPDLHWRIVDGQARRWLHVRNAGTGHARLSRVHVAGGTVSVPLAAGLLGYVLPGAERRWALPETITASDVVVTADVNGRTAPNVRPLAGP